MAAGILQNTKDGEEVKVERGDFNFL